MRKSLIPVSLVLATNSGFCDWWIATIDSEYAVMIFGYGSSIVIDDSGYPHIAYSRSFNIINYASFNPWDSSWTIEFVDSSYCPRMKFDSKGLPHIAHEKLVANSTWVVTHYYKDSTSWHSEEIGDTLREESSNGVSIVIDDEDIIHLAYTCDGYSNSRPHYAKKVGSSWFKELIDTTYPISFDGDFSIALDTCGFPCVAWVRNDVPNILKFARRDSIGWRVEIIDSSLNWLIRGPVLCIDKDNNPRIAYLHAGNFKYAWFDSGSWNTTIIEYNTWSSGGLTFTFIDMAIDSEGYSHIAYDNQQTNTRKYAKGHGFVAVKEKERMSKSVVSLYPTIVRDRLMIKYEVDNKEAVEMSIYSILGQRIESLVNEVKEEGKYVSYWIPSRIASGVYFCRFKNSSTVITKKFVVIGG